MSISSISTASPFWRVLAVVALASPMLIFELPVAALAGSVEIAPIESDLAKKAWAVLTSSGGSSAVRYAADGDPQTAWVASSQEGNPWLTIDLGGAYDNIRKVAVEFPDPGAVYRYVIDASADGRRWKRVADRSRSLEVARGAVHLFSHPGTAYLRVTLTGASLGAPLGVSEISVYNYLRDDLILGADLSYADQNHDSGLRYYLNDPASAGDLPRAARDAGMQYARLRIWNAPRNEGGDGQPATPFVPPYQSRERTAVLAQRISNLGMALGIDFHYADSWADPNKQPKPASWAALPFDELVDAIYKFTYESVQQLVDQGTTPAKVAIGNEIINGFLWGSERELPWVDSGWCATCYFNSDAAYVSQPGGGLLWQFWGSEDPAEQAAYNAAWDRFATLQASGIRAVRDVSARNCVPIEVETHVIVDQGELDKTQEFWSQLLTRIQAKGQDTDVLAHSYYPEWHGSPDHFEANLHAIAAAHPGYAIDIAETSHPSVDYDNRPVPNSPFPETIQGQADAIQRVFQIANDLPDNRGDGVLIWEPANWQEMIRYDAWPTLEFNASVGVFTQSRAEAIHQDVVYATVLVGEAPNLPPSVRVLHSADGSLATLPVTWSDVAPGATDAPGRIAIAGATAVGPVSAVVDVVASFAPSIVEPPELRRPGKRSDVAERGKGPSHRRPKRKAGRSRTRRRR